MTGVMATGISKGIEEHQATWRVNSEDGDRWPRTERHGEDQMHRKGSHWEKLELARTSLGEERKRVDIRGQHECIRGPQE